MKLIGLLVVLAGCATGVGAAAEDPVPAPTDDLVSQAAVRLLDGDWLVYERHLTANSAVDVKRIGPGMTGVKWKATLKPGVAHKRVSRGLDRAVHVHVGRGKSTGEVEFVVSAFTGGFRETLDLANGKSLKREDDEKELKREEAKD